MLALRFKSSEAHLSARCLCTQGCSRLGSAERRGGGAMEGRPGGQGHRVSFPKERHGS